MKKILILFLLIPTFAFSQGWERTYGTGIGYSVQQTTDGGYIVIGYTFSNTNPDVYLIKTDSSGDTLWTKAYGGDSLIMGFSGQQTTDGGYIVTGSTTYNGNPEVYLIKTDSIGDALWTKTYNVGNYEGQGTSIQQTIDGGYIITGIGNTNGNNNGYEYVSLIKTDSIGDTLWTKTYGGNHDDAGYSVQQTIDGGYIITGAHVSISNGFDLYLIKTDSIGDTLWTKTYGGGWSDIGYSVQQTTDKGYIITGYTTNNSGHSDIYLIKTDSNGDTLWTKAYGGYQQKGIGYSVKQTTDGGFIITGCFYENICLIKTDSMGDILWLKTYGGQAEDIGYSVQQTTDGGYVITGTKDGDIYLIKTDGNGNTTFIKEILIPNPNRKLIKIIDLLGREIIYPKKNIPYIEIYDDGSTEKKVILE